MSPLPFDVQRETLDDGVEAITVRGELDMNTAPELERALEEAIADPGATLMLDLCDCEFIDSTGIALIVRTWQRLDREGGGDGQGRLVLCSHNHQVRRLLQITGVESTISLHERREDALSELRETASS
ncbi:MAG TPA: STAS domain-containing protein [Solirubrobacterales bacterium]|nr:STAS domain-containing protein [Solirubrobacterales bacterium]